MLRRLSRYCLLLVAVLSAFLGAGELMEQFVELAVHGHLPHSVPDEVDPFCNEQGEAPCEGPSCVCHSTTSAVSLCLVVTVALHESAWEVSLSDDASSLAAGGLSRRPLASDDVPRDRANAPPTPPPNATV